MIVIDAGHGGADPGASGNGIIEKDLNLNIALYMYNRFKELGIPVKIIREIDETVDPEERVKRILDAYGNDKDVVVISNHTNAGGGEGAEVIYALRNTSTLAKNVLESLASAGQVTRKYYQKRLPSDSMKDYYFIHRNTGITEPILVEYGFLDNVNDANRLKTNYEKYAEAVVKAVAQTKGLKYVPPLTESIYVVEKGDSLYSISKKLGVSISELRRLNNLTSDLLSIGQILILAEETIPDLTTETYTVVSGDNLYSIANKFGLTVNELKELNGLTSNLLSIGQILKVKQPSEEIEVPVEPEYVVYVVKKGDSLYSIARQYNTTVDELKSFNKLTSNLLSLGQEIFIPIKKIVPEETIETTYIVQPGDNLYSIAKKYNTTISELNNLNNLTSSILSIGQIINVPSTTPQFLVYKVQKGDSLYSIAKKFNTNVNSIKELNNLSTNLLSINQELLIPEV